MLTYFLVESNLTLSVIPYNSTQYLFSSAFPVAVAFFMKQKSMFLLLLYKY